MHSESWQRSTHETCDVGCPRHEPCHLHERRLPYIFPHSPSVRHDICRLYLTATSHRDTVVSTCLLAIMRLLTALSAGLVAVSVSALPSFTTASQVAVLDDDLEIPGDNPLSLCSKPKDWILDLESVDLSPNPPKP